MRESSLFLFTIVFTINRFFVYDTVYDRMFDEFLRDAKI